MTAAMTADDVFRDWNTPGVPSSGDYNPEKSRIRKLLKQIAGGTAAVGDYRGTWSNATAYNASDIVTSGGSLWYAKANNSNVTPVEGATWTLFLPGATVADGVLTTAKYQDGSITGPKLAGGAVTLDKINDVVVARFSGQNDNFLPNTQWQLWTGMSFTTKTNSQGTGTLPTLNVTSFQTVNGAPLMYCSDTSQLKVGDIVKISAPFQWGYAGVGYKPISGQYLTGNRVISVNPNVSFTVQGNMGAVSPAASAACTIQVISMGDYAGAAVAADGWDKSNTLAVWADDFSANACPGALRTMGVRKGSNSSEITFHTVPSKLLRKLRGRTVTFGILVWQKVKAGSGTWRIGIDDGINSAYSSNGTGNSYANPDARYGAYEFKSVSFDVPMTSTQLTFSVSFNGNSGDVYYLATPTAVFGTGISKETLGQREGEVIKSNNHWNPPLLTPMQFGFGNVELVSGSGYYGYQNIDLEAIALCACHNSVTSAYAKMEWQTGTVGAYWFAADHVTNQHLDFGPQTITNVSGINNVGQGEWPLYYDGTVACFTTVANLVPQAATIDFWDVRA